MAQKLNPDSAINDPEHNVKAREDQIKEGLEELYQADRRIKAATEKHIQPDRDVKRDIKKNIRENLNITTQLLNARYATYRLERQAGEAGDDTTLDVLRELHEIAPVGTQGDMVAALQKEAAA